MLGRGVAVGSDHVTVLYETTTNNTEKTIYTTDNAQFGERVNVASSDLHFLTFKVQQEIRKWSIVFYFISINLRYLGNCTAQFLQDSLAFNNPDGKR